MILGPTRASGWWFHGHLATETGILTGNILYFF